MSNDPIPTVRSFYRALTLRAGVFTDRFVGRERPLAQSRLLFEIGRKGAEVRSRLDLDPGYLSRLLRSLEGDGLIEVAPLESDLRSRRARLTVAGLAELKELDRLGDRFAEGTLGPLSEAERARLVEAMSEVEKLLNLSFTRISVEDPDNPDAKWCLEQYFAELGERFEGGFDAGRSIPADSGDLRPPRATFLLARLDGRLVGCGAVKSIEPGVGSGNMFFDDVDVLNEKHEVRKILGYLPQDMGIYPGISAEALLDHFAVLKGLGDPVRRLDRHRGHRRGREWRGRRARRLPRAATDPRLAGQL